MKLVTLDYGVSKNRASCLFLRNIEDNRDLRLELAANTRLNWQVLNERHCVGFHSLGHDRRYVPCPTRSPIPSGIQCEECVSKDDMLACVRCDGTLCRARKSVEIQCSASETSVYLVSFGRLLKVGVSSRERLRERWLEQGAEQGIEVAVAPSGRLARLIEGAISKKFLTVARP